MTNYDTRYSLSPDQKVRAALSIGLVIAFIVLALIALWPFESEGQQVPWFTRQPQQQGPTVSPRQPGSSDCPYAEQQRILARYQLDLARADSRLVEERGEVYCLRQKNDPSADEREQRAIQKNKDDRQKATEQYQRDLQGQRR